MLTHLSDMDTVSVCSFRPQKPHMQIAMNDDVTHGRQDTGPKAQVLFIFAPLNFQHMLMIATAALEKSSK